MDKLGNSPLVWCEFDEDGKPADASLATRIGTLVRDIKASDVVVLSHGWKNERSHAERLYSELWGNTVANLNTRKPDQIVVCGVLWPATKYQTLPDERALGVPPGVGGAASIQGAGPSRDLTVEELEEVFRTYEDLMGPTARDVVEPARKAADGVTGALARSMVEAAKRVTSVGDADAELAADARPYQRIDDSRDMVVALANPPARNVKGTVGGAQGLGSGAGQLLAGPRAAVARFLNQLTYFEMKKRAGVVGNGLASSVLTKIDAGDTSVRLHLVGHSFGARLVTAAAAALPKEDLPMDFFSLTLLQGAFSHNALAAHFGSGLVGAFPGVVGRPTGPIAMTHTHNDLACTLAYALASRLSWDRATSIGDANDVFGAMGANGAQNLADDIVRDHETEEFKPVSGKVNRFFADNYVMKVPADDEHEAVDAHNNVANPTIGRLLASVLET